MVIDTNFWKGRRVLLTGHTGFKGAWLALWLQRLGARVSGLALTPETAPNLYDLLKHPVARSEVADINDRACLERLLREEQPEVILHLAAQSLVRRSYDTPVETFATNVLGTVNLLHAASRSESATAIVIVTSDKCYENLETGQAYAEDDRMGGRDPYSASKGCTELATASMRASYFAPYAENGGRARVASARAGNVIGGGDWSMDRLVPDIVRGCLDGPGVVSVRSPNAVRPWQHVLEPLRGYLMLAEQLSKGRPGIDTAWNFGPEKADERSVMTVAQAIVQALGRGQIEVPSKGATLHEAHLLQINSAKARTLGWAPVLDFEQTIALTADWYRAWAQGDCAYDLSSAQIDQYMSLCESKK